MGGRIPRALIPAVDKGVQETMKDGVVAGYPLTGIRVACYDGSSHPVIPNKMAFRTAARIGLKKAWRTPSPWARTHGEHHGDDSRELRRCGDG